MFGSGLQPKDAIGALIVLTGLGLVLRDPSTNAGIGILLVLIGTGILFVSDLELEPRHVVGAAVVGAGLWVILDPDLSVFLAGMSVASTDATGLVLVALGGGILLGPEVFTDVVKVVFGDGAEDSSSTETDSASEGLTTSESEGPSGGDRRA